MKKLSNRSFVFCCALLLVFSCQHEESLVPVEGSITFSTSQEAISDGRVSADNIPTAVVVSIQDAEGKFVYENHKLPLLTFGQGYISESLKSEVGSFKLTAFVILNSANQIIYASPVENSDKAQYVSDPLPIVFSVSKENTTQVVPQVLAVTKSDTPESFGYASFGFDVVDVAETVPLKVVMKMKIGEILYENVEGSIKVKGFDVNNGEKWSTEFPFSGPLDNVLPIKNGFHHYTLEMDKWGMTDSQTITAQELLESRADGQLPVTYVLVGSAPAKKIDYYVEYQVTENNVLQPQYKVEYQYSASGEVARTTFSNFSPKTLTFEMSQYSLFTWSGGSLIKLDTYLAGNQLTTEETYQYGGPEAPLKITNKGYGSGVTGEMTLSSDDGDKVKAHYKFSNGGGFDYDFLYTLKNVISDKTARGAQLCQQATYTYDRNINPFKHLGYVDYVLRNYSINNTFTEDNHHLACSFPTLVAESHDYTYDNQGYPTLETTRYNGGKYIAQTQYFYR